jgi:hypothetical protein
MDFSSVENLLFRPIKYAPPYSKQLCIFTVCHKRSISTLLNLMFTFFLLFYFVYPLRSF